MKRRSFLKTLGALVATPAAIVAVGCSPHPSGAPRFYSAGGIGIGTPQVPLGGIGVNEEYYDVMIRKNKAVQIKFDSYFDGQSWRTP